MSMETLLLIMLILLLGALSCWSHSQNWRYMPSGFLGRVAIVLAVLLVMERI